MDKGATLSTISVIMGIYSFTVMIFELPSGIMADLIGRKKMFILSLILSLVYSAIILLGRGFFVLCAGIFIYGLNRAASSGSFEALFIDFYIDEFGKDNMHHGTTLINVLEILGLSVGALVGGLLPEVSKNYFHTLGTYDLNLLARIPLIAAVIILSYIFINETNDKAGKQISLKQHISNSSNMVMKNKNIICIFISVFSTGFFLSSIETYWQPHFISMITDDNLMMFLGVMSFLYFAASMAGSIFSSKIMTKTNIKKMYLILRIILFISLILMALQTNVISFAFFYSFIYFIFGMANIPEGVIINAEILSEFRASILSVNSLMLQFGVLTGSLVNSIIIKYAPIPILWMIAAGVVLLSVLIIYNGLTRGQPNKGTIEIS
jgi:MFS family permease